MMCDRRAARRYGLSLPVIVCSSINKGTAAQIGKTREISNRSICFTVDHVFSVGAELDIEVLLPVRITGGTEVCIKVSGRVVRVDRHFENGSRETDVAAIFDIHEIV